MNSLVIRCLYIVICFTWVTSCDIFTSKDKKAQELLDKKLLEIDWNDVDNYPLFENCDETLTKIGQRECFENELLANCGEILRQYEFILTANTNKKVYIDFLVDQDGRVSVLHIEKDIAIDNQMPEFNQLITQGLEELPPLEPALKRGIPVKAKFRIPIVLKSNK